MSDYSFPVLVIVALVSAFLGSLFAEWDIERDYSARSDFFACEDSLVQVEYDLSFCEKQVDYRDSLLLSCGR